MIKIREPIKTALRPTGSTMGDTLYDRINANYRIIASTINGQELLHMVTAPPEIYLAEGEQTRIVNNASLQSKKEENIEIINNFINRIVVSANGNLTYQDRVYISSVLHRLGIKNEERFMKEVSRFYDNSRNVNRLIELYENYGGELYDVIREYKNIAESGEPPHREEGAPEGELTLHRDIFNRLFTESYGDIVNNFNKNNFNNTVITSRELELTSYNELSKSLYLNTLQSLVRDEKSQLYYLQDNYYEDNALNITEGEGTNIENSLISALTLDLVKKAYITRQNDLVYNRYNNYDFSSALYGSEDTFLNAFKTRIDNFLAGNSYSREEFRTDNRAYGRELKLLSSLIYDMPGELILRTAPEEGEKEPEYMEGTVREETVAGNIRQYIDESLRNNITNIEGDIENTYLSLEHSSSLEAPSREELERINRQNIINQNRYIENLQRLTERIEAPGKQSESPGERSRREALMALENPEELELTLRRESEEIFERRQQVEEAGINALPELSREIFQRVTEYLTEGNQSPLTARTEGNLARLAGDIQAITNETEKKELVHRETVSDLTEIVTKLDVQREREKLPAVRERKAVLKSLELAHRVLENTVDEELLEELREQRRINTQKSSVRDERINTTETTHTTVVNNNTTQHIEENNRNIEEIIRNSVKSQLGTITDRVYQRLERRLGNERIRRGY